MNSGRVVRIPDRGGHPTRILRMVRDPDGVRRNSPTPFCEVISGRPFNTKFMRGPLGQFVIIGYVHLSRSSFLLKPLAEYFPERQDA